MPKDYRFPPSAIEVALVYAGIDSEQRQRFLDKLESLKPKTGRRAINDSALLSRVAEIGGNVHAACIRVTQDLPDSLRKATFKRIYRKAKANEKQAKAQDRMKAMRKRLEEAERDAAIPPAAKGIVSEATKARILASARAKVERLK